MNSKQRYTERSLERTILRQQHAAAAALARTPERCPAHVGEVEPCPVCAAYIAAGL